MTKQGYSVFQSCAVQFQVFGSDGCNDFGMLKFFYSRLAKPKEALPFSTTQVFKSPLKAFKSTLIEGKTLYVRVA